MGPFDINWCEAILAYKGNSLIHYGAGSVFPFHAFDVGDEQQARLDLTTNRTKLEGIFSSGFPAKINWDTAWGYEFAPPVIVGINDQTSTTETNRSGKIVTQQPFTALINEKSVRRVISLGSLKCWQKCMTRFVISRNPCNDGQAAATKSLAREEPRDDAATLP